MGEEEIRPRPAEADDEARLAEAARGVVRQSADPRLDAHLEKLFSGGGDAPARRDTAAAATLTSELEAVRGQLEAVRSDLAAAELASAAARRSVTLLGSLLAVSVVAIVALLVLVAIK